MNLRKPYPKALRLHRREVRRTRRVPVEKTPHFDLKLSETALALREINSLGKLTDEERARRLEELKQSIRDGTYRVDSFLIAERILREEEPHLFY